MKNQQHWLSMRSQKIGSSDSPAICGVSPFKTASDVYWEKVTGISPEMTEPMYIGTVLEDALIKYAEDKLTEMGISDKLRKNQFRVSPQNPLFCCTCDALGKRVLVEAKTSSYPDAWGQNGTSEVPDYVLVQVQHQFFCTGAEVCLVPVLLGNPRLELRCYVVYPNEDLISAIVERGIEFWNKHILPRVPPDNAPPPLEILKKIPRTGSVELSPEANALIERYVRVQDEIKSLTAEKEKLQELLLQAMGTAEHAHTDLWEISYRQVCSRRIDSQALRARFPEIAEQVTREVQYREFRVKEVKR